MILTVGGLLSMAGALLLYAGAPNQRIRRHSGRSPALLGAGGGLLALSLLLLLTSAGPATAVFIWMTLVTLVWSTVPLVAAWLRRPREALR